MDEENVVKEGNEYFGKKILRIGRQMACLEV